MINLILELSEEEKKWWEKTIKIYRNKIVKEPKHYIKIILQQKNISRENLTSDFDNILITVREEAWKLYLGDECTFHTKIIAHLVGERELPKQILSQIIKSDLLVSDLRDLPESKLIEKFADIFGNYSGRIMPYIYSLSLSTTNSRRSRAGKNFEQIIETFMEIFGHPFENQSSLGTIFYSKNDLGKKVDLIVPSAEAYVSNRSKCAVVTMKTTLRERWQEVAEELNRTNVPHIYLLTIDNSLTANVVTTMKHYNITLVVYSSVKSGKFAEYENVQDFLTFFTKEVPHIVGYWSK